jgi:drug/metabolite transporter (DMT)-like permease
MGSGPPSSRQLDPAVQARLLRELQTPWRGLRRALWLALAASGGVGLAAMALRLASGQEVASVDLLIQLVALVLFAGLLWFDRDRDLGSGVGRVGDGDH